MILVIKVNEFELHDEEFVRPVTDLLEDFKVVHYKDLKIDDLDVDKIIICGTALKDNFYLEHLDRFEFLKNYKGKVLGICAGTQIIGKVFGKELIKEKKIGVFDGKYYLHSFKVDVDNGYMFHPEVLNKEIISRFAKNI